MPFLVTVWRLLCNYVSKVKKGDDITCVLLTMFCFVDGSRSHDAPVMGINMGQCLCPYPGVFFSSF